MRIILLLFCIVLLNQVVHCWLTFVGKVETDPSRCVFCTDSNHCKIFKMDKGSTVSVIKLFYWRWYTLALTWILHLGLNYCWGSFAGLDLILLQNYLLFSYVRINYSFVLPDQLIAFWIEDFIIIFGIRYFDSPSLVYPKKDFAA